MGTVLSLWDAAELDAAGEDGEVLPKFINLTDASIKMVSLRPLPVLFCLLPGLRLYMADCDSPNRSNHYQHDQTMNSRYKTFSAYQRQAVTATSSTSTRITR